MAKIVPYLIRPLVMIIVVSRQLAHRLVINPAVGYCYFPPRPRSPFQPQTITALWSAPNCRPTACMVTGTCVCEQLG